MWTNVIGQERAKHILRTAIQHSRLPGAYLFTGPEGVGKDAAAFEFAKVVNCLDLQGNGDEACDRCENCIATDALVAPFLTLLYRKPSPAGSDDADDPDDLKSDVLNEVREQLELKAADKYHDIQIPRGIAIQLPQIRQLRVALSKSLVVGRRRIVIISDAESMIPKAQNALLKTLEEPHANSTIILTSANAAGLLPTIHSRCQEIRFDSLQESEIADALVAKEDIDRGEAEFLSKLASGSYSQARAMIGEDIRELRKEIVAFLRSGLSRSRQKASAAIDEFLPRSGGAYLEKRVAVEQRLKLLALWLRDALALATGSTDEIVNSDQRIDLDKFVANLGNPPAIIAAIRAVEHAQRQTHQQLQLRPVMLTLVLELEAALL